MFNLDHLDADLHARSAEEQQIAAALLELDGHTGVRLLTADGLTGETAARWDTGGAAALANLWRYFTLYRETLAAARSVRGDRANPAHEALARLHELLSTPSIEVSRTAVALPERGLTGTAEQVEKISLAQLSDRMRLAFDEVIALAVPCAELHDRTLSALTPLIEQLASARSLAADLGVELPELSPKGPRSIGAEDPLARSSISTVLSELARRADTDPLSLADGIAGQRSACGIGHWLGPARTRLDAVTAQLAELVLVRDGWAQRLAELDDKLALIDSLGQDEVVARGLAGQQIRGLSHTAPPDQLAELRARRDTLNQPASVTTRSVELRGLSRAVDNAIAQLREAIAYSAGLLDRRTELRGRFRAYQAKAVRLGLAGEPPLRELESKIRALLWSEPTDLGAATRAIAAYQQPLRQCDTGQSA